MPTLRSIQYLRALAALAVVSYHAGQWVLSPISAGAAGVDIFFLISGFVMWTSTWNTDQGPLDFLWRRLIRVAPLYWTATGVLAIAAILLPGFFPHVVPEPAHILKSLLFIPHYSPEGGPFPLLSPGWTLGYEAIFYLAFAAALLGPRRRRMIVLAAILTPLSVLGLLVFWAYPLFANPMLLQFLAGAAIGRLWLQRALPSARVGAVMVAAGALMFVGAHVLGAQPDLFVRPLLWGVPAAALVVGALSVEAGGVLPRWRWVEALGDASYSIYLCHFPLLVVFNKIIGPTNPYLFVASAMPLMTAAGLICHALVERPLLALLRRPRSAPTEPVGAPRSATSS